MDLATLKKKIADVPSVFPQYEDASTKQMKSRYQKSDIVPSKILCSDKDFAAFELESGLCAAIWAAHVDVAENKEALLAILNGREKQLLEFGVNK